MKHDYRPLLTLFYCVLFGLCAAMGVYTASKQNWALVGYWSGFGLWNVIGAARGGRWT